MPRKKGPPFQEGLLLTTLRNYLVVGWSRLKSFQLGVNYLAHFPNPCQVWINVTFGFLVEDPLAIEKHLHYALASRGNRDGRVWTVVPEKFIRHPRGDSVVLSTYAVSNLYLKLPFHSTPPHNP